MMIYLNFVAQSPIHIAEHHAVGNVSRTLDYIPGTALRGALAEIFWQSPKLPEYLAPLLTPLGMEMENFFDWAFLSGDVRFPNLYPSSGAKSWVLPLTARSCKINSGFKTGDKPGHGCMDNLLRQLAFDLTGDESKLYEKCQEPLEEGSAFPCQASLEPFSGFYQIEGAPPANYPLGVRVSKRTITRTAIDDATQTAAMRQLFSLEVLEETNEGNPQYFSGYLTIAGGTKRGEIFLQLLKSPYFSRIAVGSTRSRGFGALALEQGESPQELPPLEKRLASFNDKLHQLLGSTTTQTFFALTLQSDAIVLDPFWRYQTVIDETVLEAVAENDQPVCLKRWFADTRRIAGWNTIQRLPKETELAIQKGSVFLFESPAPQKELAPWLQKIEEEHIGERQTEGFGECIICHPFHLEVEPK